MGVDMTLDEYQSRAAERLQEFKGKEANEVLAIGLVGEIGSFLAVVKKCARDEDAFAEFVSDARDECGDALWYFSTLCHQKNIKLSEVANGAQGFADLQRNETAVPSRDDLSRVSAAVLLRAATSMSTFASGSEQGESRPELRQRASEAFADFLDVLRASKVSLVRAAHENLQKTLSRWPGDPKPELPSLPDAGCDELEQLPRHLEVEFRDIERNGKWYCFQLRGGLPLGDRLTDNARESDGYRFHDVFHLVYAAKFGWSPVLRDLLRLKRKSDPKVDETQDGARAKIVEEGIANWLFAKAEDHGYFKNPGSIDFATLKTIKEMTRKLEIADAPYWLWEEAIREGFEVFSSLKENHGGTVTINLIKRSIEYAPPVRE